MNGGVAYGQDLSPLRLDMFFLIGIVSNYFLLLGYSGLFWLCASSYAEAGFSFDAIVSPRYIYSMKCHLSKKLHVLRGQSSKQRQICIRPQVLTIYLIIGWYLFNEMFFNEKNMFRFMSSLVLQGQTARFNLELRGKEQAAAPIH